MHGAHDPTIPIAFGERLFALAHEPKRFVRFPEGGHDDLDDYGAIETARRFIECAERLTAAMVWRIVAFPSSGIDRR